MQGRLGSQIWALGLNVFREAMRDRLLHVLVGSGALVLLFSLILGQMSVGGQSRVVQNTGFWLLGIWGLLAVLYLGSNIVRREIRQKTVYLVLARAVDRPTFLMGKFVGMLLVLLPAFVLLAAAWLGLMLLNGMALTGQHFWALLFIFGEWILLSAFSLLLASFTSPLLHNFFLVGITFLGHWSNDLRIFAENAKSVWLKGLLNALYHSLPTLEALNFREAALYNTPVEAALLLEAGGVFLGWLLVALVAANLLFSRRRLL